MHLNENFMTTLSVQSDKILSGIFAEIGTFNQNGRRYNEEVYIPAYEKLIPKIKDKRLLGELDHPLDYDEVRLSNVSHAIIDSKIVDENGIKKLYGTIELLDTPAGLIAQALVKAGINLGISSRGLGATRQVRDGADVTQLQLITYDLVAEPSFATAILSPEKSQELSDSLDYIESQLSLNESIEENSLRSTIYQIRESLITEKTVPSDDVDIDKVEIESLKELLESTHATIKSDTEILIQSREKIKGLERELTESKEQYDSLLENMMKLQEAYNALTESSTSKDQQLDELNETVVSLRKRLAVETRGMSYSRVSDLLEGATTESEIESRLDSLSSVSRKRQTQLITESTQTKSKPQEKRMSRLASIISKV